MEGSSNRTPVVSSNPTPTPPDGTSIPTTEEVSSIPTTEGDNLDETRQPPTKRQRSVVWDEFRRIVLPNGEVKAECIYCLKKLSGNSKNGTTSLRAHLNKCVQRTIKTRSNNSGQTLIMPKTIQGQQEIGYGNYDPENTKNLIANAIIMHDYPLSIVDHIGFRRVLGSLQPLFKVPSRNTIKKEIFKVYDIEKTCVMKMLDTNVGRVAITTDMWTASNQKRGYMAITAHYIDGSWTLQSRILRFIYVPAPHTAERLCHVLVECLMDWNIDSKLSTITLDNCTTNDKMICLIKDKLWSESLIMDGSLLHMRCCAHILNLIVKEGLQVVQDGVENIRDSVVYWSGTPKRKEKFEETARQLRIACTRNLALDCSTRWNSTFKMLEIAIQYKDVFIRLSQRNSQYTCLPTDLQWKFAKDVCGCLGVFNDITEIISGTRYPTANLYFSKVCKIKLGITSWANSSNPMIKKMAENMMKKFESYWSVIHDIMGVSTVLDPSSKMKLIKFQFEKLYGQDSDAQVLRIKNLCYDLLRDYQEQQVPNSSVSSSLIDRHDVPNNSSEDKEFEDYVEKEETEHLTPISELDKYLSEKLFKKTPEFDILNWWKTNGGQYPTLQKIARDVLPIPITSVASESAFSTGGRILSPHRSRLNWTTVEALMCARSWLWSNENDGNLTPTVAQEYATVLNEMESDDEAELMSSCLLDE